MTDHRDNDNYQHADAIAGWIAGDLPREGPTRKQATVNASLAQVRATLALTDQVARIADALDLEGTHTSARGRNSDDSDEALVDKADEDSTVRPGLYVGGRRVGAVAGPWEWGADGEWHRTSWTPTPVVQWHYTESDPDESLAKAAKEAFYGTSMIWDPNDSQSVDWRDVARAAREHIDAERSEWDEWYKSGWEAAIGRAERAEAAWEDMRKSAAAHQVARWTAEAERDAWKGRYTDVLWRIGELHRAWLSHKCRSGDCEAAHREHAEHLADLLFDEGDNDE